MAVISSQLVQNLKPKNGKGTYKKKAIPPEIADVPGESGRMKPARARFPADSPTKWADLPSKCEASSPACFSPLLTNNSPQIIPTKKKKIFRKNQLKGIERWDLELNPSFKSSDLTVDFCLLGAAMWKVVSLLLFILLNSTISWVFCFYIFISRKRRNRRSDNRREGRGSIGFLLNFLFRPISLGFIGDGMCFELDGTWQYRRGALLVLPNCPFGVISVFWVGIFRWDLFS